MADNSPNTTIESIDGQIMEPVPGIEPIPHNQDDIHDLDPPMLDDEPPSSDFSNLSFDSFGTEIEDALNASNNTTNESVSFNAGRKSLKKKRKTKKRKSIKKRRKTKKRKSLKKKRRFKKKI